MNAMDDMLGQAIGLSRDALAEAMRDKMVEDDANRRLNRANRRGASRGSSSITFKNRYDILASFADKIEYIRSSMTEDDASESIHSVSGGDDVHDASAIAKDSESVSSSLESPNLSQAPAQRKKSFLTVARSVMMATAMMRDMDTNRTARPDDDNTAGPSSSSRLSPVPEEGVGHGRRGRRLSIDIASAAAGLENMLNTRSSLMTLREKGILLDAHHSVWEDHIDIIAPDTAQIKADTNVVYLIDNRGTPVLHACTLPKLVCLITDDLAMDRNLISSILTCFGAYTKASALITMLLDRYSIPPAIDPKKAEVIKRGVALVLKQWVDERWIDFVVDPKITERLDKFIGKCLYVYIHD